jgi:hypothetical protein
MPEADPTTPFYPIVTDHDRNVFAVEGPMTGDRPWKSAERYARDHERRITCGPRFYLQRGFRLNQVQWGAIDETRKLKPSIPSIGAYGIPMHDELDLCRILDPGMKTGQLVTEQG